ncbi:hypothetical protein SynA1562_00077 [Synechococcus sp. A15-62]|uniref:hypothetical protein n=1 Tax=Synechococcus sp. A15-62 TaxID=1050657 RepID=UPI001646A147|nr:hypothetical protein [Synechococcus sp. A15-62]QNI98944.1 hypothetical protein SynA1562_00077 [Synechococcus sp. A15-62]
MDADFEQHYQAAERAYGLGEYAEAHAIASALWDQLQSASNDHDPSLVLGWRAVVSLLLGHIQLHGLQQPEQAAAAYERVLEGDVDATIAALAEQGLERCRAKDIASGAGTTPITTGAIPDLLKDPFLSTDPGQARPAPADVVTAMPWLSSDEEPRPMPTADPSLTPSPVRNPETMVTPAANSEIKVADLEINPTTEESSEDNAETITPSPSPDPTLTPEVNSDVELEIANQEQALSEEKPSLDAVEPANQEPAATKLLENSWLRVQLQPDIKSPTDSVEPMGLINRIKGVFARSAGR